MINAKKLTGIALATAAAGMFVTAGIPAAMAAKHEAEVKCFGINACKGKTECATASNACKGQNSCKSQGWTHMSKKECMDKGGKLEAAKN